MCITIIPILLHLCVCLPPLYSMQFRSSLLLLCLVATVSVSALNLWGVHTRPYTATTRSGTAFLAVSKDGYVLSDQVSGLYMRSFAGEDVLTAWSCESPELGRYCIRTHDPTAVQLAEQYRNYTHSTPTTAIGIEMRQVGPGGRTGASIPSVSYQARRYNHTDGVDITQITKGPLNGMITAWWSSEWPVSTRFEFVHFDVGYVGPIALPEW